MYLNTIRNLPLKNLDMNIKIKLLTIHKLLTTNS